MYKKRIGNDIRVLALIRQRIEGVLSPFDMRGRDISVGLVNPRGVEMSVPDFEIAGDDGSLLAFNFYGKDQRLVGIYTVVVRENDRDTGMRTVDKTASFELVSHSHQEVTDNEGVITIESLEIEMELAIGTKGDKGDKGEQGPKGDKMTYADLTEADKADLYEGGASLIRPLLDGKQDKISDLDAIRQGAEKGSTALQSESDPIYMADKPNLALKSELNAKVDKEDGKVLSSNDYTDKEKAKLTELEEKFSNLQVTTELLKDGSVTIEKLSFTESGKNKFNKDVYSVGVLLKGQLYSNYTDFTTSDYIPVKPNANYVLSVNGIAKANDRTEIYDENKSYIGNLRDTVLPMPSNARYCRFSLNFSPSSDQWASVQFEEGNDSTAYEPYHLVISKEVLPSRIAELNELHSIRKAFSLEKKFSALNVKGIVESGKVLLTESVHVYPNVALSAHIDGEISNVKIGCGYNGTSFEHYAFYAELTPTEVKIYYVERSEPLIETLTHGLTLTDKTDVSIITENNNSYSKHSKIIITTSNGDIYSSSLLTWFGAGNAFIKNDGSSTINVSLSLYPRSINSKLWVFGDSYFSFWNNDRWGYYLFQNGMNDILFNHLSGQSPSEGLEDLKHLLSTGHAPSYIVWCLGMNGAGDTIDSDGNPIIDATKKEIIDWLVDFCSKNEITLILSTIPTAKVGASVLLHEGLNKYVRSLGVRYIDFADAVGSNEAGTWIEGLCADGVHPTIAGAKVLFGRALCDCPELATNTLM